VLRADVPVGVEVIEADPVRRLDHHERPEPGRRGQAARSTMPSSRSSWREACVVPVADATGPREAPVTMATLPLND
jgi:hypothetical protein